MHVDKERIASLGTHRLDPPKTDIDPLAYSIERLQTYLIWCAEHRASYEKDRINDITNADNELDCLKDSIENAILHLQRLTELVLAGYSMNPEKSAPKGLCGEAWGRTVEALTRNL